MLHGANSPGGSANGGARPRWSTAFAYGLGPEGSEYLFTGKALLLDQTLYCSVSATVEALNNGDTSIAQGFCVIYSHSKRLYFLLWREGKEVEAKTALGIEWVDEEPLWSTKHAFSLGPRGTESLFEGRARLLDTARYTSLVHTVRALNAGHILCDLG